MIYQDLVYIHNHRIFSIHLSSFFHKFQQDMDPTLFQKKNSNQVCYNSHIYDHYYRDIISLR